MNDLYFTPNLNLSRKIKLTGWFLLKEQDLKVIENYNEGKLDRLYVDGYFYTISMVMDTDGPLYHLELTRCKP